METRIIDRKLDVLRDKLLLLGGTTEKAVYLAMRSLVERDSDLARKVIEDDKIINAMELEIDQMSVEILALQQPAAHDLRFVISVAKITPILERIADHAANIAEASLIINNEPEVMPNVELPRMAEIAGEMLQRALDAFTSEDAKVSKEVIKRDKAIDKAYNKVFDKLTKLMIDNPSVTNGAAHLLFVAKHLERIGDYVKDICEMNVYLIEAAFIKHKSKV
ncbi:MAG: phosphate transport system regulatory protein PhoU [Acidobacteria bacterium]|nr:MAG: phosphate transport system regulatory protein PhoU [Acidobacteriota bacterium]REJ99305.1 MAG: phosphate transport system regulatory protein PhoU [Acidobacteriota bacterium]REK15975.1 MAG: phosphate transport system regulatory protein PhoU [Acidobacteriota bacterium]REK43656.1 MAG: phosphate transport system regulatory protein PhoU [Acidobacteriota bacterium]